VRQAYLRDLLWAGAAATVFGGIPSTLWALARGDDVTEATRAAGAMLVPADSSFVALFAAAAVVHTAISFFWTAILVRVLPRRHVMAGAVGAALVIGVVDLKLIAPFFFPEVAALAFLPQMADHAMWGATLGVVLAYRWRG
jgi:hypothetical protein